MDIKTILSKPLPVIWYRFVQLVKLIYFAKTNFWQKKEINILKILDKSSVVWKHKSQLFVSHQDNTKDVLDKNTILSANRILEGKISIFEVTYTFAYPLQWNEDWRYNHKWENNYYKNYSFYEKNKTIPYDVKFPWELSRLSFLIPVARAYKITKHSKYLDFIAKTLKDWKINNPMAYSVNWYAMEVSMRSINLIQLREILLLSTDSDKTISILNEILLLQGVFLWRNIEYTDVRGNHYSANLTALLLLGTVFKKYYIEANKWFNYAVKRIEKEFHLQFINDGVNFEKSIPYHRLVVEFYLISFVLMKRLNISLKPKTLKKFKNACFFIKGYTKPNKLTPIIGDNDSASVFKNDNITLNNHTNILQLASLFFKDNSLNIVNIVYNSSFDIFGMTKKKNTIKSKKEFNSLYYKQGGFLIAKKNLDYFIVDVGEVGMNGRGGHGHNDLFSFELFLDNKNIIVDAGCYTYTGDLVLKNEMKSSNYHNGLTIDNEEIAPLIGDWSISNIAKPYDQKSTESNNELTISAKHNGYQRLNDAVEHKRIFKINKTNFSLRCDDLITCNNKHTVERFLHFAENINLSINDHIILATQRKKQYKIIFDKDSKLKISNCLLSYNYGSKLNVQKVIVRNKVDKTIKLSFIIKKN